jgi:hypothetical protein
VMSILSIPSPMRLRHEVFAPPLFQIAPPNSTQSVVDLDARTLFSRVSGTKPSARKAPDKCFLAPYKRVGLHARLKARGANEFNCVIDQVT